MLHKEVDQILPYFLHFFSDLDKIRYRKLCLVKIIVVKKAMFYLGM